MIPSLIVSPQVERTAQCSSEVSTAPHAHINQQQLEPNLITNGTGLGCFQIIPALVLEAHCAVKRASQRRAAGSFLRVFLIFSPNFFFYLSIIRTNENLWIR